MSDIIFRADEAVLKQSDPTYGGTELKQEAKMRRLSRLRGDTRDINVLPRVFQRPGAWAIQMDG